VHPEQGSNPHQPADDGKVVSSEEGCGRSATKVVEQTLLAKPGGLFMSEVQDGDEGSAGTALSPDRGEVGLDGEQKALRRFHPVVIKGGLTPRSEVSDLDRIRERLIRLGVRPGGRTFAEAMRRRLREEFPWIDEETLDSIEKYHF